tara:strand:+ start:36 stop:1187 length:1152 start_codon:yes stop_codon:yes gene_type:complete
MKIFIKIINLVFFIIILNSNIAFSIEKIKIGLLVPLSGAHKEIGKSIVQSVRLAINKIDNPNLEILPRDTGSNPEQTLKSAKELGDEGVKVVIGPIFNENLIYLSELDNLTFLSLTNRIIDNPKNIISAGINARSQLKTIKKFQKNEKIKKTIFLIPKEDYKREIKKAILDSRIKTSKIHYYETDPTKLTKQIEKITRYSIRKQNLEDEIKRLENLNDESYERQIEKLKKRDTLGKIGFDSVIIADFDESLKSITTSLLYTDISPKKTYFITLNQWFDKSLLNETSAQPIYFPSINKENYDDFIKIYFKNFNEYPNQLSFLSYDLMGLVYYLIIKNELKIDEKMFVKKNMFRGKIGVFEIKNNKIDHILNFYKVEDNKFKKIF